MTTSDSINQVKKVRVSRFDQGPKNGSNSDIISPVASTSTLPSLNGSNNSDTNGHYSKNNSFESYRFTSSTSRTGDKPPSPTFTRSSYIPSRDNPSTSYIPTSLNRDDRPSSSRNSNSFSGETTRISPTSQRTVVPPPPSDYFLPTSSIGQNSLDFAPRNKKPRPVQSIPLTNLTTTTKIITTTTTINSNSSNNSSRPSPNLSNSIPLPTSIPTGPRKPTVYALGPTQSAQNSYIPNGSRQSESQPRPSFDDSRRSNSSSTSYPIPSASIPRPPPVAPIPPDHYKPSGTKDYIIIYDRALDNEAVKSGKELVYRYDGEGIEALPTDPRKNTDRSTLEKLSRAKSRLVMEPSRLKYNWDKNSTGAPPPPPPSAVLVTGFPGSTTHGDIHRYFSSYGKISTVDTKTDPKTGGSLGICWISFIDNKPRGMESDVKTAKEKYDRESRTGSAQDGHAVAQQAVAKGNGSKIGARMMSSNDVVKVVMDGEGLLTKAAVASEILRRKAPIPAPPPPAAPAPPPYQPPPPPPSVDLPPRPPPSNFAPAYSPPIFIPSPFNNNPLKPLPLPFKPRSFSNNSSAPHSDFNSRFQPDFPSNPTQYNTSYVPNVQRNGSNSLPPPPPSLPPPPSQYDNRQSVPHYDSRPPPPPPPPPSHLSNNIPSGPRASHSLPAHLQPDFASLTPHAKAIATGRPLPTDPYIPMVFSGQPRPTPAVPYVPPVFTGPPPIPQVNRHNSTSKSNNGREPTKMSEAVAAAVLAAKRRLYHSTADKNPKPKVDNGEVDMELESDNSRGNSDDDDRDEDKSRKRDDQIFFHRDGRREPRKVLRRGQAPAAAIAWQASPQVLRSKLLDNGKPYLFIHKSKFYDAREFGTTVLNGGDLEGHFNAYELDRTYADSSGWYITFTNSSLAREALDTLNGKPFAGAPLELTYFDAPLEVQRSPEVALALEKARTMVSAATSQIVAPIRVPKVKKLAGWTDAELIEEAKEIVINDLLVAFKNDLKNRVVSGRIWENLAKWESGGSKTTASTSGFGTQAKDTKSISSLPSFSKKKPQVERPPPGFVAIVQRFDSEAPSDSIGYASDGRDDHSDSTSRAEKHSPDNQVRKAEVTKKKKKIIKIQSGSETDEPGTTNLSHIKLSKKQQGKKPAKVKIEISYTSSEDEDSDSELVVTSVQIENSVPPSTNKTPSVEPEEESNFEDVIEDAIKVEDETLPLKKKRGRPVGWRKNPVALVEGEQPRAPIKKHSLAQQQQQFINQFDSDRETESDHNNQFSKPAKLNKVLKKPYHKLIAASPPPIFASVSPTPPPVPRPAFIFTQPDGPVPDPFETGVAADEEDLFYLKLAIERPRIGMSLHPTPPQSEDEFTPDSTSNNTRHPTGSARTEGYYPISVAEKIANRAPTNRAKAAHDAGTTTGAGSGVAVSRLARANTRGLVRGMELHKKVMDSDTDVLKFNQLRTRKKQLTFSRSGIEGYGLFAMEHIPVGEMVIEYVGELIRQQVADRREKAYERQGIGSSYLFRVDEDLVVDATKKGNLGRLINHCCAPNCTARIITINGVKKIVIYAKTNIEPGDEVTYDYHFPHEDVKIPCLCAHPLCRKYLN